MRDTKQRVQVLSALSGGDALTAQDLHERLRARGSRIGLATVYRALRLMSEEGVVDVLRDDPTQARYRRCSDAHHHHLMCEVCGMVVEIPECDVDDWADKVARAHGFSVSAHRAEITGVCSACGPRPRKAKNHTAKQAP